MTMQQIEIDDAEVARLLYGERDSHLRLLRDTFGVKVSAREGTVRLEGEERAVGSAAKAFDLMRRRALESRRLRLYEVEDIIDAVYPIMFLGGPTGYFVIVGLFEFF